jgi:hypothetical protein
MKHKKSLFASIWIIALGIVFWISGSIIGDMGIVYRAGGWFGIAWHELTWVYCLSVGLAWSGITVIILGVFGIITAGMKEYLNREKGKAESSHSNDSKTKSKAEKSTNDSSHVPILCALLSFYSSKAVAHAGFFVASIFGLVTFSAIVQQLEVKSIVWFSTLLFLGFSYMGYYTLIKFDYYAVLSEELAKVGLRREKTLSKIPYPESKQEKSTNLKDEQNTFWKFLKKQEDLQIRLLFPKKLLSMYKGQGKLILGFMYWFAIIYLGSIVYSKFWDSILDWIIWLGYSWIVIFIVVFLPHILWKCFRPK